MHCTVEKKDSARLRPFTLEQKKNQNILYYNARVENPRLRRVHEKYESGVDRRTHRSPECSLDCKRRP